MQVECRKCRRNRSTQYMQEAVFKNFVGDEPAGVWQCSSSESCKKARKLCPKCRHYVRSHHNVGKWFDGRENVTACTTNMGMGDPCGCLEFDN